MIQKWHVSISWRVTIPINEAKKHRLGFNIYHVIEEYCFKDSVHVFEAYDVFGNKISNERIKNYVIDFFKKERQNRDNIRRSMSKV